MNSTNIQHEQVPQETETIIESGAELRFIGFSGDRHIPMNVSKEADAEFMRLLQKEDPKRYANLIKNMTRRSVLDLEGGDASQEKA